MKLVSKFFDELSTKELYEIMKARNEIFVVEGNTIYQDFDDIDYRSLHIFIEEDGKILAYLRAYNKDAHVIQMGRVLTIKHGIGLGKKLLLEGIKHIKVKQNPKKLYLESRLHVTSFYEQFGFKICSEEFLEVKIPHVQMELIL